MLHRRLQAAAVLVAEGQGAALWQGFARQRQWQAAALPAAAAAACVRPPCPPGGLRWHSELAERKPGAPQEDFEYVAPFGGAVSRVKKLSLFSCVCALGAGPIIFALDGTTTLTAKASIVGTLASFGVFTTGLLTWFTQPYVQRLRYDRRSGTVEATTLTLLAQPRTDRFHLSEVRPADSVHPLTSFAARGRMYYLDAEHFADKRLLAALVPQAAAAHAMEAASAQLQQGQQHAGEQQQGQQHAGEQQQQQQQQQQAPPQ